MVFGLVQREFFKNFLIFSDFPLGNDEKIFEKKSVIAVSICSIFLVVYERKFFLLHN